MKYMIRLRHALIASLVNVFFAGFFTVYAEEIAAPGLFDKTDYSEYWEQQFLFDNDTIATSQFLIANLPFSKHHGMMVATLKEPGKDAVVIKNGRRRSGWNFTHNSAPTLSIFQHKLSGGTPDFQLKLHNTAAELDVDFAASSDAISIVEKGNELGLPEITLYAPVASAKARWRDGPEIGGPGPDGDWHPIGDGFGYGLHVVQRTVPNKVLRRWLRFTGAATAGDYVPIMHAFETPKGEVFNKLILLSQSGEALEFEVEQLEAQVGSNAWHLKAKAGDKTLAGTVDLGKQLETFNLKDQLSGIEKLAAGSMADVSRFRYGAAYAFTLSGGGSKEQLSGRAIAEDIQLGEMKSQKRRRKRR